MCFVAKKENVVMDDKEKVEELIGFYRENGMTGLADTVEKRGYVRTEFRRLCALFIDSLNASDKDAVKNTLVNIRKLLEGENRLFYTESREEKLIAGFSDFIPVVEHRGKGEKDESSCRGLFNPFLGTPEEMLEFCRIGREKYYHPVTALVSGTDRFLSYAVDGPSPLSDAICRYIEPWLKRVIDLVRKDISSVFADTGRMYDRNHPDGVLILARYLSSLICESRLSPVCRYFMDVLYDYLPLIENGDNVGIMWSPLNTSVLYGNEEAFDTLLAVDTISRDRIEVYPMKNTGLLDKLFALGVLIPGTWKGKTAFFLGIQNGNPDEEIIRKTIHPSYFSKKRLNDISPLVAAICNRTFSPEKYYLLIRGEDDLNGCEWGPVGLPPLGYAVKTGNLKAVMELFRLGADIAWHDRWGNNIFHYICSERPTENGKHITDPMIETIFGKSLTEKNSFGRLPISPSLQKGKRNILKSYGRISFEDACDRVFSSSAVRDYSSLFFAPDGNCDMSEIIEAVRDNLRERKNIPEIMIITAFEELEEIYGSLSSTDSAVIFIEKLDFLYLEDVEQTERMLKDLYSRPDIAVIAGTSFEIPGIVMTLYDTGVRNFFMGKTGSVFYSDMFLSRGGAEVLENYEFIMRQGNDFWLVDFSDAVDVML